MENQLFHEIKNYLDITYEDDETDQKLMGIMKRGMNYLREIAGSSSIPFEEKNQAQALLFDYCRYARCNALESFETNFKSDLLKLRFTREVTEFETEDANF